MSVVDREALRQARAGWEDGSWEMFGPEQARSLVAAVDALLDGEAIWWCKPHHAEGRTVEGPCAFAWESTVDEECRMVRVVVVPIGEE